jgi:broad specificity phosphatase PhoE
MKHLYFVRHGQTEWNAVRRMQGQWNSDLSGLGRGQADINGKLLETLDIEAMFVSPLARTRQTAEIINRYLNLPMAFDDRIMEWDCGDWSGHLYDEVMQKWPEEWSALQADRFNYRGPNCENYPDMIDRARPFIEEIQAHPASRIAIVSHGMIGKVMVSILLELNEEQTLAVHQPNDVIHLVTTHDEAPEIHHFHAGDGPIPGFFDQ